ARRGPGPDKRQRSKAQGQRGRVAHRRQSGEHGKAGSRHQPHRRTSIFRAYSTNGGASWTTGTLANACCDGQMVFDNFGNLFLVYINSSVNEVDLVVSTDGGVTFGAPTVVGTGSIDQPSVAAGAGSVWVDWNQTGSMVARGA